MILDMFLQTVVACSLVVIVWNCHEAINMMTKCTKTLTRVGYLMLAGGAAIGAVMVVSGAVPSWPSAPVSMGLALIMSNQRKCPKVCASLRNVREHRRRTDPFRVSIQD
jgi:hypothetical protein